ncbi:MAG: hypothetical protein IJ081_00385 [Prevotella sp.]|jgi:hypothetical protein|nr:hypothetical protein [Prevotella sp.]
MNKNEKFVITINREVGSGGRTNTMFETEKRILQELAEGLGIEEDE